MPTIAIIDGTAIILFWNDHDPPHFHAESTDFRARVLMADGALIDVKGTIGPRELRKLRAWTKAHRDELLGNWYRVRAGKLPRRIEN